MGIMEKNMETTTVSGGYSVWGLGFWEYPGMVDEPEEHFFCGLQQTA